jgi:hypothetical protein
VDNEMMSEEQLSKILNRLDTLIRITAINAFQGKSRPEVVYILSSLGFSNKDIAVILGTTNLYVANVRYSLKKQKLKKDESVEKTTAKETEKDDK